MKIPGISNWFGDDDPAADAATERAAAPAPAGPPAQPLVFDEVQAKQRFDDGDARDDGFAPARDGDPIGALPPRAREALRKLRMAKRDAEAISHSLNDEIAQIREEINDLEGKTRAVKMTYGSKFSEEDQQLADVTIGRLRAEMDRLRDALEPRARRTGALNELTRQVERFLSEASFSTSKFVDATVALPKLGKNESVLDAVETRRRRLRELDADHRKVQAAPRPAATVKEKLRTEIEKLAEKGRPSLSSAVEAGGSIEFKQELKFVGLDDGVARFSTPDTLALVAWLHRQALIEALEGEIDQIADDEHALDDAQRQAKLAEIASDRLAVEQEEEALLRQCEASGTPVLRRVDMDVRAVLLIKEA